MENKHLITALGAYCLLVGCTKEPPPRTVDEFMSDSILLEATMVRCGQDRSSTKYDVECVNAREAINHIAKADIAASREELEAQSERKRRALRRTQEAAAEARRNRDEAERRRREAEYLGQFDQVPVAQDPNGGTTAPTITAAPPLTEQPTNPTGSLPTENDPDSMNDLESIREELERRQN
jgi:hypothetical protein